MAMTAAVVYSVPDTRTNEVHDSDTDLIARAQRGDLNAYGECVERHQDRVYGIAYQMVGNVQDAQDIAQEVFVRLHRSLKLYRATSRFTTWLYRLTINLAIDYQRSQARHRASSIDSSNEAQETPDRQPLPDADLERSEFGGAIHKIAGNLTTKQRSVFVLRDLQGFSTEEIAIILRCRQSTVRVHLAAARATVRDGLVKHYPELCGDINR